MTAGPVHRDSVAELTERLRHIEHIQQITALRTSFHHCLNDQDWPGLAGSFTEDGILDYGEFGRAVGRQPIIDYYSILLDKIVEFMPGASRAVLKNLHSAHRIRLDENSDTATGSCYFQEMIRFDDASFIHLSVGRFSDRYTLRDGIWLFESVALEHYWVVPNNEGWTWPW
ncbi:nuclear transport factor 2 family protein [Nocardia sp. NPDC003963]